VRILIVGGGAGGLATAIALRKLGMDCLVIDKACSPHETGAGLSLWSNAVRVLRFLGVEDEATAAGSVIDRLLTVSGKGRPLAEFDLATVGRDARAPSLCIHRADLRRILSDKLPPGVVKQGRCVSFAIRGDAVITHLADGSTSTGDVLIGADGLDSSVRMQFLGTEPPRYAGYTCWRGVAVQDERAENPWLSPRTAMTVMGNGSQAGLFPCGSGRFYWFATRNAQPRATLDLAELTDTWPAPLSDAIRATPASAILRNDIVDRPPSSLWGKGPLTLLGDAAHPCTPNLGQGACQALEDAQTLAECLQKPRPAAESLRAYEKLRMPRTAMVTAESLRMGQVLQTNSAVAIALRNLVAVTPVGHHLAGKLLRQLLCP
jgi:2-polyprenyl-6-methoxyphenol hydroxylase-like FAD-dependent oxidoreductase